MSGTNKKATPLSEEQLSEKETLLQELEEKLTADREALDQEKAEFEAFKAEQKAELEKKKLDLDELEQTLLNTESEDNVVDEPEPGLEFKFEKNKFKFKDSAPKNLRISGKTLSQEEIVKDKELLQKIIKTTHIEKIK